jgi:hypothetical protein
LFKRKKERKEHVGWWDVLNILYVFEIVSQSREASLYFSILYLLFIQEKRKKEKDRWDSGMVEWF